ncbi:MAG: glycosyltransferase [Candidatus Omnitrophota bacterium]
MKILLAAPQDTTVLGIITGYCRVAMEGLGHSVIGFDFRLRPYSQNKLGSFFKATLRPLFPGLPSPYDFSSVKSSTDTKINQALLSLVSQERPDIVLVLCGENISAETLDSIRSKFSVPVANWFYDSLLVPARRALLSELPQHYDYFFIIDTLEVLSQMPIKAAHIVSLPLACDPDVHKPLTLSAQERSFYGSDVAFVGTVTPERAKVLEALSGFNLKIWGKWQKKNKALARCYQKQDIYREEVVKVYNASKIVLDIHTLFGREQAMYNVTPRVFEVPACRAFLLTNAIAQLSGLYDVGEEMVTYRSVDELKELIARYLNDDEGRCTTAQKGFARVRREHTYAHRVRTLLGTIAVSAGGSHA